jgi:hypothetical protein
MSSSLNPQELHITEKGTWREAWSGIDKGLLVAGAVDLAVAGPRLVIGAAMAMRAASAKGATYAEKRFLSTLTVTSPEKLFANSADQIAYDSLKALEESIQGSHFLSRHGPLTTLEQQQIRATTGLTPDNVLLRPVDSGRWLSHLDMHEGLQRATAMQAKTGADGVFRVEFDRMIGEGYLRGGDVFARTNVADFVFRNGKPYTFFPKLDL